MRTHLPLSLPAVELRLELLQHHGIILREMLLSAPSFLEASPEESAVFPPGVAGGNCGLSA